MATVKVRVAVAVDPDGYWNAAGWLMASEKGQAGDEEMAETARDMVGEGELVHFITAELRVPDRTGDEVAATVEPSP